MSEVSNRTPDQCQAIAAESGLVCMFPRANELLLDLDGGVRLNDRVLEILLDRKLLGGDSEILETISKSGNRHAYMRLTKALPVDERIALQAQLGSDPVREVLGTLRAHKTETAATVLFELPDQARLVDQWRLREDEREIISALMSPLDWPTAADVTAVFG